MKSGGQSFIFCRFLIFVIVLVDHELRTIIDKLAVFVARNGPDFEQMTKTKQKDNPKFEFLFGGRHFDYYLRKVSTEQSSEWCWKTPHKLLLVVGTIDISSLCNLFFFFLNFISRYPSTNRDTVFK